jgi:hypothetical protein
VLYVEEESILLFSKDYNPIKMDILKTNYESRRYSWKKKKS